MFGSAHSHDLIYRGREVQKLDGYTTDLFTDEAIGFMDRNTKNPWFLYLAYNAVHTPLEIVSKNKDRIPAEITDPARRGQWKLVDWRDHDAKKNSGWQLYDLTSDIGEQHDLAAAQPQFVAQLSQEWETWNAKNIAPLWHGSPTEAPTAPARPATTKK